jgi:cytochrome b561
VTQANQQKWNPLSQIFHWLMFIIIICMFVVAYIMADMEPSDLKWQLYMLHKSTGFLMFLLVFLRLGWRKISKIPDYPATMPNWQKKAAEINIWILYALIILMPLSGLAMSLFGGHDISVYNFFIIPAITKVAWLGDFFHEVHEFISSAIYGIVGLHIIAALYHHFIIKDNILKRMLPFKN